MADLPITGLPEAFAFTGDEIVVVVQEGVTKQAYAQYVADLAGGVQGILGSDGVAIAGSAQYPLVYLTSQPLVAGINFSGINNDPDPPIVFSSSNCTVERLDVGHYAITFTDGFFGGFDPAVAACGNRGDTGSFADAIAITCYTDGGGDVVRVRTFVIQTGAATDVDFVSVIAVRGFPTDP